MPNLDYTIRFYSEWHCGSGLSAGADLDALVIRDEDGLPYVPGRTLKGLLHDAAQTLHELGHVVPEAVGDIFGVGPDDETLPPRDGECHFSNAELSHELASALLATESGEPRAFLFRQHSATAVDERGQAVEHSLRRTETTIPLTLHATITDIPDENSTRLLAACMKYTKRLGANRNRGLGRCDITPCTEVAS